MTINPRKSVRELAVEIPGATRIFEELGIDYCCGGERSLDQACLAAGVSVERVVSLLEQVEPRRGEWADSETWVGRPLAQLTSYIISRHHAFAMPELVRLSRFFPKVCSAHGHNHPELLRLQAIFQSLAEDLAEHMQLDEQILFPYIEQMEAAARRHEPISTSLLGLVRHPVHRMTLEAGNARRMLGKMRHLISNCRPQADECTCFQELYQSLEAFERDLHQHIHLENNILFPRALELENEIPPVARVSQEHPAAKDSISGKVDGDEGGTRLNCA